MESLNQLQDQVQALLRSVSSSVLVLNQSFRQFSLVCSPSNYFLFLATFAFNSRGSSRETKQEVELVKGNSISTSIHWWLNQAKPSKALLVRCFRMKQARKSDKSATRQEQGTKANNKLSVPTCCSSLDSLVRFTLLQSYFQGQTKAARADQLEKLSISGRTR